MADPPVNPNDLLPVFPFNRDFEKTGVNFNYSIARTMHLYESLFQNDILVPRDLDNQGARFYRVGPARYVKLNGFKMFSMRDNNGTLVPIDNLKQDLRSCLDLKLFRILNIIMNHGPRRTSILVSKLLYEFNYCASKITEADAGNRENDDEAFEMFFTKMHNYVKVWYNYQLVNQKYLAYAAFVFYGMLYANDVEGTTLYEEFYRFLAFFTSPYYSSLDNWYVQPVIRSNNLVKVMVVTGGGDQELNNYVTLSDGSSIKFIESDNSIEDAMEIFLQNIANGNYEISTRQRVTDVIAKLTSDGNARAFVNNHRVAFINSFNADTNVQYRIFKYNGLINNEGVPLGQPLDFIDTTEIANGIGGNGVEPFNFFFHTFLSYEEIELDVRVYRPPANFNDALDWEHGRQPFHGEAMPTSDNNYTTLYDLKQEFPESFCLLDKIRNMVTYYESEIAGRNPSGDWSLSFPLLGQTLDVNRSLYDCASSVSFLEKIVGFLLNVDSYDENQYDYYRIYNIVVDMQKLIDTCKRRRSVYYGQYRPVMYNRRRYRALEPRGDTRMSTEANLTVSDVERRRACELYSCSNIGILILACSSYGIRNFATCRFDVWISHWKNMVQWYSTLNPDFYRSQVQMNLCTHRFDARQFFHADGLNPVALPVFTEAFLALFAQSYTNDPSDLPKRPKAGMSASFENVCLEYYGKMKQSGRLPLYDPYKLMTLPTVGRLRGTLETQDVFRVLIFGYPDNLHSPWHALRKMFRRRVPPPPGVGGGGGGGGDDGDGGDGDGGGGGGGGNDESKTEDGLNESKENEDDSKFWTPPVETRGEDLLINYMIELQLQLQLEDDVIF